jgi:hypothetical protein
MCLKPGKDSILGVLLSEFVDQIHGLQSVGCEALESSLCVFERGKIPFRFPSGVDVAQGRADIVQDGIEFRCGHGYISAESPGVIKRFWSVFGLHPEFSLKKEAIVGELNCFKRAGCRPLR